MSAKILLDSIIIAISEEEESKESNKLQRTARGGVLLKIDLIGNSMCSMEDILSLFLDL